MESSVRSLIRSLLIACLISGLLNASPAMAAAKPVGMVVLAENAHLSGVTANIGADVFAGDVLHTDPGGNLRMKFGATQLYPQPGQRRDDRPGGATAARPR